MWSKTPDGTVVDKDGRIIFFSAQRFVSDICLGNCCFICGVAPGTVDFNDEHILPDWLLRQYGLHRKTVNLPNATLRKYAGYRIQCCKSCNSMMGELLEKPLSQVLGQGLTVTNDFAANGGILKLIVWLGLIFFKTHLNDKNMRHHLDARKGTQSIAEEANYDWSELHHLHTIVRCFYSGSEVTQEAVGSFLTLPVRPEAMEGDFDFLDFKVPQTIYLRMGETALFAVFNDSGGALNCFMPTLDRITGPVSELQAREIAVELAGLNLHIKDRTLFQSKWDRTEEWIRIEAERPEHIELVPVNWELMGELKSSAFRDILPQIQLHVLTPDQVGDLIHAGRLSFLFDDEGQFIKNGRVS
jgi:hypothetical protein